MTQERYSVKFAVKFFGVILIFLCFAVSGFSAAKSKREYIRRLKSINCSLKKAENLINLGTLSRGKILANAFFGIENLRFCRDGAQISDSTMNDDIKGLIEVFFREFGSGDILAEQERIRALSSEITAEISRQEEEYTGKGRLWRTAGICAGMALAVMII